MEYMSKKVLVVSVILVIVLGGLLYWRQTREIKGSAEDYIIKQTGSPQTTAQIVTSQKEYITCSIDSYNCSSFKIHKEAQKAYNYCMDRTGKDVHGLDGDQDGIACEILP